MAHKARHYPLQPLVESVIRTLTRGMPSLEQFCFDTQLTTFFKGTIAFQMADAGSRFIWTLDHEKPPEQQEDESRRCFKIWVGPDWEVPDVVLAMEVWPAGSA